MIIGIDASNIRSGGDAHLMKLLKRATPIEHKFEKIIVWSSNQTLQQLPSYDWLIKISYPYLNRTVFHSTIRKLFIRDRIVKKFGCDVLFLVDATFSMFHPSVTICHNILPFSKEAIDNYNLKKRIYIKMMKFNALIVFKSADKVIMLSNNSMEVVSQCYKKSALKSIIIPHGFNKNFENAKATVSLENDKVIKLIYIIKPTVS